MGTKTDKTVVRNAAYRGGEFNVRERHNERKNEGYLNADIEPARADMNVHFRKVFSPAGELETYEQTFSRLIEEGKIVKRGLKPDAKVFDELIFDVNSAYFENNGGYEYAKSFFEEAYRLAVKEVGGEDYILSAVLHADERNKALSEELGRDVYHYHLHVVYVPVVRKEILWSKRTKDKSLIGKVKEVIPQISHSKKWPMRLQVERGGKTVTLNSYSLLQDRFYEHMRAAGFDGFERGERGSTAEHLSDLEYKIKMENERLAAAAEKIKEREQTAAVLKTEVAEMQKQSGRLDKKLAAQNDAAADVALLDSIGEKKNLIGQIIVTPEELKTIKAVVKKAVKSLDKVAGLTRQNKNLARDLDDAKTRLKKYEGGGVVSSMKYIEARERAPKRMADTIADIMRQPPERRTEQEHEHGKNKSRTEAR